MLSRGDTQATRPGAVGVADDTPLLTQELGPYRIIGVVGSGGMGVVYEAFDERLRRRVAIKRLHGRDHDLRILCEAQALARLAHPNVVSIFEIFAGDARLCIVMELVVGRTLRTWIDEAQPSQHERLDALIQAGRGIAAAHAAGLVHRDLKPDNIMIGDDGRVRVLDFGVARAVEGRQESPEFEATRSPIARSLPATDTRSFVGTPGYRSPEQHLGVTADARSDVFSFCVLAFEMLHGQRPVVGGDDGESFAPLAGRIAAVPGWIDQVLRRGLAVSPADRWPSMDALLAALADDPRARARRRGRAFARFRLAGLVAAALTYAVLMGFKASSHHEEAVPPRICAVEVTITRAEAEGDEQARVGRGRGREWPSGHGGSERAPPVPRVTWRAIYTSAAARTRLSKLVPYRRRPPPPCFITQGVMTYMRSNLPRGSPPRPTLRPPLAKSSNPLFIFDSTVPTYARISDHRFIQATCVALSGSSRPCGSE